MFTSIELPDLFLIISFVFFLVTLFAIVYGRPERSVALSGNVDQQPAEGKQYRITYLIIILIFLVASITLRILIASYDIIHQVIIGFVTMSLNIGMQLELTLDCLDGEI